MTGRENRYHEAINAGHSAAWEQNWDRAAEYYKQALDEKPEDPKALSSLALALFEIRAYQEALEYYLRVAQKTPQDPVPLEKIAILYNTFKKPELGSKIAVKAAEIYLTNGDVNKAIENWGRATEMNPENVGAYSRLAIVNERMKRIPQAVSAYLQIASIMQHTGQIDKAIQVVNRALMLAPEDNEVSQALETLREGKMLPKVRKLKSETVPMTGFTPSLLEGPEKKPVKEKTPIEEAEQKALAELAELFFEQTSEEEERDKAKIGGLKQIVDGTGPLFPRDVDKVKLRLYLGQVVEFLSHGDKNQAAEDLKKLIEMGLHHPAAYYHLGVIRFENDRLESAIRYLRRSVNHKDYALASRLLIAEALRQRGLVNEAAVESLEALKIADVELVAEEKMDALRQLYDPLIEAHAQKSNKEASEKLCDSVAGMLLQPSWRQKLQKVRNELFEEGDHLTPIAEVLTEVSSSQVVVAMSTIRQFVREGRRHAAFEEALFALQEAPTYLPLHITIGDILLTGNQTDAAIEKFKVVARSYTVRGEAGRAVDMLRRVVDLAPLDLAARQSLIDQLVFGGQNEEAIQEYFKMADVYYSLAELADARKTYTKGLRFVEQAGLGEKWRVKILQKIADIDVQSLNWRQGLTIFEKICSIVPEDLEANRKRIDLNLRLGDRKEALNAIDDFLRVLKKDNRPDDAVEFLEKLCSDWPQEAMIKSLLAERYQDLGRTQDAIDQYDDARAILFDRGNKEGSVAMLKRIIALGPDNIDEYQQLLQNLESN